MHNGGVPKIDAPTVAEHHAQRRAAILDAAVAILAEQGPGELTPAAVAAATGLARTSVYQYYPSTAALIAAGVEETFRRNIAHLEAGLARARTPEERVRAYVDSALDAAADGHEPTRLYFSADLPDACRAALHDLHRQATTPLVEAIADLGVDDPESVAQLVGGVISAGASQITAGRSASSVRRAVRTFVERALGLA